MHNHRSLGHVYDRLVADGLVQPDQTHNISNLDTSQTNPWYVLGLIGCGGWIAAGFLLIASAFCISFVFGTLDSSSIGFLMLVLGGFLTAGTTFFTYQRPDMGVFTSQLLVSMHIAGHGLLVAGMPMFFNLTGTDMDILAVALYTIVIQLAYIMLFPNVIYRFIAVLVITFCLNLIAITFALPWLISFTTAGLIVLAFLIWADQLPVRWQITYASLYQVLGYGVVVGALGTMISEVSNRYVAGSQFVDMAYLTTILLFACLILLEMHLLSEYRIEISSRLAIAIYVVSALVGLVTLMTPGILAGIIILLLAFRRRNLILQGIAYVYLAGFISYYYYWLEFSLLTKSIILIVTGLLLIAGRFLFSRFTTLPENKGEGNI